jgi:hypothetical protein
MKNYNFVWIILISSFLTACATPEERKKRYADDLARKTVYFDSMPNMYICGKFYKLEYFTGRRERINDIDVEAAAFLIAKKGINCKDYYGDLIKLSVQSLAVHMEADQRRQDKKEIDDRISKNERDLMWLRHNQTQSEIKRNMDEVLRNTKK